MANLKYERNVKLEYEGETDLVLDYFQTKILSISLSEINQLKCIQ